MVVPHRARKCPTLLNAILSAAARFFSTLSRPMQLDVIRKYGFPADLVIGDEIMLHYHSRCIAQLRLASEQPDAIMDEDLLAAVVVLRFYEELDSTQCSFSYSLNSCKYFNWQQVHSYPSPTKRPSAVCRCSSKPKLHQPWLHQGTARLYSG